MKAVTWLGLRGCWANNATNKKRWRLIASVTSFQRWEWEVGYRLSYSTTCHYAKIFPRGSHLINNTSCIHYWRKLRLKMSGRETQLSDRNNKHSRVQSKDSSRLRFHPTYCVRPEAGTVNTFKQERKRNHENVCKHAATSKKHPYMQMWGTLRGSRTRYASINIKCSSASQLRRCWRRRLTEAKV